MDSQRLTYLLNGFLASQLNEAEEQEFRDLAAQDNHAELLEIVAAHIAEQTQQTKPVSEAEALAAIQKIVWLDKSRLSPTKVRKINFRRIWWAAAIVLLVGTGAYLWFIQTKPKAELVQEQPVNDVEAPQLTRASITLPNGEFIYLDSADAGTLRTQDGVAIVNELNGQVVYEQLSGTYSQQLQYHTLANPRGSKVVFITLADDSRVWLNAGSTLTYPVAFIGRERNVRMTGEAYFEITHDKTKPFFVEKNGLKVEVLGTRFNVNVYEDEPAAQVTLVEGSVKVNNNGNQKLLKPGQQAVVTENIQVFNDADLDQVLAWKNGAFWFNNADIAVVLRQLAVWYDVQISYPKGNFKKQISGSMGRDLNLSEVLEVLSGLGVKGRIEGKNLYVEKK